MNKEDSIIVINKKRKWKVEIYKNIKKNNEDSIFPNNLQLVINIKNTQTKNLNKTYISNNELKRIMHSGDYVKFSSYDVFNDILELGTLINKKIIDCLKNNPSIKIIKGFNHYEELFNTNYNLIIDNDIKTKCLEFCKNYNEYVPFGKTNNLKDFIIFIMNTWETVYISKLFNINEKKSLNFILRYLDTCFDFTQSNYYNNSNISILNSNYSIENFESIVFNYLEKYHKYERFSNNIVLNESNNSDDELFELVLTTEELISVVIAHLKRKLCSLYSKNSYFICENCGSLFYGRNGQKRCTDDNCRLEYDRNRK